jgi:hypothetical protein
MYAEWQENALPELARNFTKTRKELEGFQRIYAAALNDEQLRHLDLAIQSAVNGSVKYDLDNLDFYTDKELEYANEMYNCIKSLEKSIDINIQKQTELLSLFHLKRFIWYLIKKVKPIQRLFRRPLKKIIKKLSRIF